MFRSLIRLLPEGVNAQQANDFVLSEGVYVNDRILGDSLAFLTVNYASVDWMEVHLFPEEEYNGLTLWGSKLDDKTVQVKEEYTGIVLLSQAISHIFIKIYYIPFRRNIQP